MASKRVKLGVCGDDRISSLPDGVLCHILSFLPTKYSVRTSALSTRWKHLFTFVPNLDFKYESISSTKQNRTVCSKFMHFVNSVFMSYNVSRMNKFRVLFFHQGRDPKNLSMFSWISGAIRRHVKVIDIYCFISKPVTLPLDLFSCKTLTSLNLAGKFNIVLPSSVCLPCLRTCNFVCVKFDAESAKRLFRSCPVLERLALKGCIVREGVEVLDISSPTLKKLFINGNDDYKLMLNLPNLLKLSYTGPVTNKFLGLDSLKSLVDASVFYESYLQTQDGVVLELVCSFYNVQSLSLNCSAMEAFTRSGHSGHSLPNFENLTTLTLNLDPITNSRLLPSLLHNSPRLEYLNIENECEIGQNDAGEYRYLSSEHVPACVSQHLKEVKITFTGLDYERELIKYLMKYAYNLKKMIIRSKLSWSEQYEISSEACEVVVDVDDEEIYDE